MRKIQTTRQTYSIDIPGNASTLTVTGNNNEVSIDGVGQVIFKGNNNEVSYKKGDQSADHRRRIKQFRSAPRVPLAALESLKSKTGCR